MWQGIPGQAPMMPGQPVAGAPQMPGQQRPKLEPIDWNLVAVLDADLIRRTKDYDSLQRLLQCFLTARLVQGNSRILAHPLVLRLCQLLQVGIEYLNFCQGELQNHSTRIETEKIALEDRVKTLEHKIKKMEMLLKVKSRPYHRCPVCDKKFKGLDYIDRHILNRHSELMDAWDVVRGRKRPEKSDSVQEILDKIESLKSTLKKGDLGGEKKRNIEQQLFQTQRDLINAEEQQDEEALRKREEIRRQFFMAADDLNSSINLWKEQKASAPQTFNLFQDKPVTSKPPEVVVPAGAERIFGKQADIEVDGPQFDAPEPVFEEPPKSHKVEEPNEEEFPKRFTKDVMRSARNFVSPTKQEGRGKFAQPNVESVMAVISERVRKEMAKMKDQCKGTRITTDAVDARMGGKGADYEATRLKLMKKLERECPLEGDAPVKMEMKTKQGKAKVVEAKPVEISLIHTDYFETKESSEYSDFTEEQMSSTVQRDVRPKKSPEKPPTPKQPEQKMPRVVSGFESSEENEESLKPIFTSQSGVDPEALSEGSHEEEFTSAFELPPKIAPLDSRAQKEVIESVLDFEEEEDLNHTSFDLSPMPTPKNQDKLKPQKPTPKNQEKLKSQKPTPKNQDKRKKQDRYEYEYSYEYYSETTPKKPAQNRGGPPNGTVLASARHINRHRAEDTKAVFLSESEGSPIKSPEVVVTKKKQEIDYDKLAKEKLRKEFDFVFDEEEELQDKQDTIESVQIEPMYTSQSGVIGSDFSISGLSTESSQLSQNPQLKFSFQITKGPSAVSIAPQSENRKRNSSSQNERQKPPAQKPPVSEKRTPSQKDINAEMARQAAALTKKRSKGSTKSAARAEEWEDDFSRDASESPNSPPRRTPEKRERPRVKMPVMDSDDEFEQDYAVNGLADDEGSEMFSPSPIDTRSVPKKKLRQTFYESPKAPSPKQPSFHDDMSSDPEPVPKPAPKKSVAAFLGKLFGKR